MSVPHANLISVSEMESKLVELMSSTRCTLAIASSMGRVTSCSTDSGPAPGYCA
ncbi:MAG: hypothetical protein QM765_35250 [Myxococcales bacterium]